MPMVSESRSRKSTYYALSGSGGSRLTTPFINYRHDATQYGWRSKGETEAADANLALKSNDAKWADTIDLIAAYDRIERAMSDPLVRPNDLPCHEREYVVEEHRSATPKIDIIFGGSYWTTVQPNLHNSIAVSGAVPTETDMRAVGGNLIRASRPTAPHANLSQWFGELRQTADMFSVPTELPAELQKYGNVKMDEFRRLREGGRSVGSGYLASQFGWLPFIGEVITSLESIAQSGPLLDEFARNSAKLIRRSRSRQTFQDVAVGDVDYIGFGGSSDTGGYLGNYSTPFSVDVGSIVQKSMGLPELYFRANVTVTRSDSYRAGALYEYFVADPANAVGMIQKRAQEAKYLLGDPLVSLSTFWELTPWSWAVDWNYNLGGLLSFQESVATDSLVARRAYTIFERKVDVVTRWTPVWYNGGSVVSLRYAGTPISTSSYRFQRRLPGSPYDMGIDWSGFSSQKWFILGALGLAKAPGVKP